MNCATHRYATAGLILVVAALGPKSARLEAQQIDERGAAQITRGAELFSRNCQRCHNLRGPAERTDREWIIIMQHMETRANLTVDRANAIRAFLLASNEAASMPGGEREALARVPAPDEVDETMLSEGRRIYRERGTCAACHGPTLEGSPVAPSLIDDKWMHGDGSLAEIVEVIRNGVEGTAMAPYPAGIDDEMAVMVAAYVWAVSQGRIAP